MTLAQGVAERTKQLLKERNTSQYSLIKQTGLDKTTVQTILKGKTKDVKLSTVFLIADFFGMTLSEFLVDEIFNDTNIMM